MDQAESQASFGPVIFIGLTAYVLVTSSPADPEYANPADMMELDQITRASVLQLAIAPAVDYPPPETPALAPRVIAMSDLAPAALADALAQAVPMAPVPVIETAVAVLPGPPGAAVSPVFDLQGQALPNREGPAPVPPTGAEAVFAGPPPARFHVDGGFEAAALHDPAGQEVLPRFGSPFVGPVRKPAPGSAAMGGPARPLTLRTVETGRVAGSFGPAPALPAAVAGLAPVISAEVAGPGMPTMTTLATPAPSGLSFIAPPHVWLRVAGNGVNVRTGPGTEFASRSKLSTGARGLHLRTEGDWSEVLFLGPDAPLVAGWMFSAYLVPLLP